MHLIIDTIYFQTSVILLQADTFDQRAGQQGYFTFQHKWLILTERQHVPFIERTIHKLSNVVVMSFSGKAEYSYKITVNGCLANGFVRPRFKHVA